MSSGGAHTPALSLGCWLQPFTWRNVCSWHIPEVPPAAKEGRLRLQSGLWQAVHERVYEFTP